MSHPIRLALRVAGIYLVLAALWIVLSDRVVEAIFPDPDGRALAQTAKGLLFIAATAALIGGLIHRDAARRREAELRYRSVVDQSLVGIYVLRGDRILFANARLAEIFGYTVDELVSSVPVSRLIAPADREMVARNIRRREEGHEEDIRYTFTGLCKDGQEIRAEVHGRRVWWEGEPAVLGVLVDVTEKERLEAEAHQRQRLETLGQLTAAVTHDFKNLLTAISTPVEMALERLEPDHPAREDVADARESTDRAVVLIRQLLSFCRQRTHRPRAVNLTALGERVEPMLRSVAPEGVEVHLELPDTLPHVWADPDRMEHVLLNLTLNAIEAVGEEGVVRVMAHSGEPAAVDAAGGDGPGVSRHADVHHEDVTPGERVVLEVTDDGPGMDEETRKRVFEPFFTTKEQGTGLGLATVHGIVAQANGGIAVESAPAQGTTFRVEIPASRRDGPAEAYDDPVPSSPSRSGTGTVLVVDDDEGVRRVTARALERHGYRVLQADTGRAALDALGGGGDGVDLVIADVALPDADGTELASRAQEQHRDLPILLMSGRSEEEVLGGPGTTGRRRFMEKPFSVETLLREVERAMA